MARVRDDQKELERRLRELGNDPAMERFLSNYGNVRTKAIYASHLAYYFRWLGSKGITKTPSEMVRDNLVCIFKSDITDVETKRRHTDLMNEYVNRHLVSRDSSEARRELASAAIRMFYRTNDSVLFGHFKTSESGQGERDSAPPLFSEDVRQVLMALNARSRAPLLISWQSGVEINRVLDLDGQVEVDGALPVKLNFPGRKGHRMAYSTFVGRDSVEAVKALGLRRFATYDTLRTNLHDAAKQLAGKGLLKNPDPLSWHPHALRHSFKTEAMHAGVAGELIEFFMGHAEGIRWVYDHRSQVHPEDMIQAYRKIEPYVSIHPDRVVAGEEFADRERELKTEIDRLGRLYVELKKEIRASRSSSPSLQAGG